MNLDTQSAAVSRRALWSARVLSALAALFLLFDAVGHMAKPAPVVDAFVRLGYPLSASLEIGIIELLCLVARCSRPTFFPFSSACSFGGPSGCETYGYRHCFRYDAPAEVRMRSEPRNHAAGRQVLHLPRGVRKLSQLASAIQPPSTGRLTPLISRSE